MLLYAIYGSMDRGRQIQGQRPPRRAHHTPADAPFHGVAATAHVGVAYYLRSQTLLRTAAAHARRARTVRRPRPVHRCAASRRVPPPRARPRRNFALLKADEDGFAEAFLPALLVQGTSAPGKRRLLSTARA
jgi:hypothetical protein